MKPIFDCSNIRNAADKPDARILTGIGLTAAAFVEEQFYFKNANWHHQFDRNDPATYPYQINYIAIQKQIDAAAKLNQQESKDTWLFLNIEFVECEYPNPSTNWEETPKSVIIARFGRDFIRDLIREIRKGVVCKGIGMWAKVPTNPNVAENHYYYGDFRKASNDENNWGLDENGNRIYGEGLADELDAVCPYAYFGYPETPDDAYRWVNVMIAECRRAYPDKPCFPFLRDRYTWWHRNPDLKSAEFPPFVLREALRACEESADGATYWTDRTIYKPTLSVYDDIHDHLASYR